MVDSRRDIQGITPKILDANDETAEFYCGEQGIDEFIRKEALGFQKERLGVTYLFKREGEAVGFVTLSMADLKRAKMGIEDRLAVGIENYPALLIGQLAVCKKFQAQDVGTFLCDFCLDRALRFSERVGCRFIVVNAIESAIGFYQKYGFVLLPDQKGRKQKIMFLNILSKTVET
jgi:GNAT superfamily N-acetyltransferase